MQKDYWRISGLLEDYRVFTYEKSERGIFFIFFFNVDYLRITRITGLPGLPCFYFKKIWERNIFYLFFQCGLLEDYRISGLAGLPCFYFWKNMSEEFFWQFFLDVRGWIIKIPFLAGYSFENYIEGCSVLFLSNQNLVYLTSQVTVFSSIRAMHFWLLTKIIQCIYACDNAD